MIPTTDCMGMYLDDGGGGGFDEGDGWASAAKGEELALSTERTGSADYAQSGCRIV